MTAELNDPELIMKETMTEFSSYEIQLPQKYAGVNVNTAAAFHDRVLAEIDVLKAQESLATGIEIVDDEMMVMKSESIIEQLSRTSVASSPTFWPIMVP